MISSIIVWTGPALLFFWTVGAYNRLVRLRSRIGRAFVALDAMLVKQLVCVQANLPPSLRGAVSDDDLASQDVGTVAWATLRSASDQFAISLAQARERPTDPTRVAALASAQDALDITWLRVWHQAADLGGEPLPQVLEHEHERLQNQTQPLIEAFNAAVLAYNQGIAQFPALLLALLFRFRPAGPIHLTETVD